MKVKAISSKWLYQEGRRLDSQPYTSDGFILRQQIKRLNLHKDLLSSLTLEGEKGIFIAPYFKRVYVQDPKFGIPLLGNTDILMSEPNSSAPLLSRRIFKQYPGQLELREGWT